MPEKEETAQYVPGTKVLLSDMADMAPLDAMGVIAQGLMASDDGKERVQGANLQLKVEGLRQPESKDVMSPFVLTLLTFVATMINETGIAAVELIDLMMEECPDCSKMVKPVYVEQPEPGADG